ncbi:MAG: acetate kinase, partial [Desulfobacula sp.]|nr:acetate kinase [Desulfobacula sp.]
MKILIINTGSSSLKYKLFNMKKASQDVLMASGIIERIGEKKGKLTHTLFKGEHKKKLVKKQEIKNHKLGMHIAVNMIIDRQSGVLDNISQIDAVGHRIVQGGEEFTTAVV